MQYADHLPKLEPRVPEVVVMDSEEVPEAHPVHRMSGFQLYSTPEFKALCQLIGIAWELQTIDLTIHMTMDKIVVTQSYLPSRKG